MPAVADLLPKSIFQLLSLLFVLAQAAIVNPSVRVKSKSVCEPVCRSVILEALFNPFPTLPMIEVVEPATFVRVCPRPVESTHGEEISSSFQYATRWAEEGGGWVRVGEKVGVKEGNTVGVNVVVPVPVEVKVGEEVFVGVFDACRVFVVVGLGVLVADGVYVAVFTGTGV